MNISNETKVGSLTAISIVLLILGFNFLKGRNLTVKSMRFYAVFENIEGLTSSNAVVINGKQVGTVYSTDGGEDMRKITVALTINQLINIPDNSIAVITPSVLGVTSMEIRLGNSKVYKKEGDTLASIASKGMLADAFQKVDPVLLEVSNMIRSLDSVLVTVNSVFDTNTKNNIKSVMANLNNTTASLAISSASLQAILNTQSGALAKTLNNVSDITGTLKNSDKKIDQTLTNLETTTSKLSKLDLEKTLTTINATISDLKNTIEKVNSDKGSIGLLINDPKLYNNLSATSNKLNLLLDDVRVHPKRYINVSVFGKKDKNTPLTTPLPDTMNAPYTK
jgi:phospholipid/cholesterol/gamma-HCH transport system substrate-binding protein